MFYLGYDIGSSSIKAALVNAETNQPEKIVQYPEKEMEISSPHPGWAEQDPDMWWNNIIQATKKIFKDLPSGYPSQVKGIGISYQMHGLVLVDKDHNPIRPSIIWCDSRAIESGDQGARNLGEKTCFRHLLNTPGNFTASKLRWVRDHEPEVYDRIHKFMLPGDYVALKLTGEAVTTTSGLSEGIMWDFLENKPAQFMFDEFGIREEFVPTVMDTCSEQGRLTKEAASLLGLPEGIPVGYRAGDQPNNAMSLGVLNPGEIAATGGTSGVVYGVLDEPIYDPKSRVNGFTHVNHTKDLSRIGVLLCINGSGIQYSWTKYHLTDGTISYPDMEKLGSKIPIGCDGLVILPFGNGAERMLNNREVGARVANLSFNRHGQAHYIRASLEGIAYSFVYGMNILKEIGLKVETMKVGNDNLFQSSIFSKTIASLMNANIELVETTGAVGAAKAVGYTLKDRNTLEEAISGNKKVGQIEPEPSSEYEKGYENWSRELEKLLT